MPLMLSAQSDRFIFLVVEYLLPEEEDTKMTDAEMKFYERDGYRGDERCIDSGLRPRWFVQIDGYMAELPPTTNLRPCSDYIHLSRKDPLPDGIPVAFQQVEPWLPNCGTIALPDGRVFRVRDHELCEA